MFQSTPLMRGATQQNFRRHSHDEVSIHAPHARGDVMQAVEALKIAISFNPRPSCEGRRNDPRAIAVIRDVSIHAPHARGDGPAKRTGTPDAWVSIHAPHARGDHPSFIHAPCFASVSIHAPHARGDKFGIALLTWARFVSIHAPHARGDIRYLSAMHSQNRFNPRPSCEGRLKLGAKKVWVKTFQSTPLMRGATAASTPTTR